MIRAFRPAALVALLWIAAPALFGRSSHAQVKGQLLLKLATKKLLNEKVMPVLVEQKVMPVHVEKKGRWTIMRFHKANYAVRSTDHEPTVVLRSSPDGWTLVHGGEPANADTIKEELEAYFPSYRHIPRPLTELPRKKRTVRKQKRSTKKAQPSGLPFVSLTDEQRVELERREHDPSLDGKKRRKASAVLAMTEMSVPHAALQTGMPVQTAYDLHKRFTKEGLGALEPKKPHRRAKPLVTDTLTVEEKAALESLQKRKEKIVSKRAKVVLAAYAGRSLGQIVAKTGMSDTFVRKTLKAFAKGRVRGVYKVWGRQLAHAKADAIELLPYLWSEDPEEKLRAKIVDQSRQGYSTTEIAQQLGVGQDKVRRRIRRVNEQGLADGLADAEIEDHDERRVDLTDAQRRFLRWLMASEDGETPEEVKLRARIVLLRSMGHGTRTIAKEVSRSRKTVMDLLKAFLDKGERVLFGESRRNFFLSPEETALLKTYADDPSVAAEQRLGAAIVWRKGRGQTVKSIADRLAITVERVRAWCDDYLAQGMTLFPGVRPLEQTAELPIAKPR